MDTLLKIFLYGIAIGIAPAVVLVLISIVLNVALHLVGLPFVLLRLPLLLVARRSAPTRALGVVTEGLRGARDTVGEVRDAILRPVYRVLGPALKWWFLAGLAGAVIFITIRKPSLPIYLLLSWALAFKVIPFVYVKVARALGFRAKMTPITAKRIARFRSIKRGHFSFVAIVTLFVASWFLELTVNNKPLKITYGDQTAYPAVAQWFDKFLALAWWGVWILAAVIVLVVVFKVVDRLTNRVFQLKPGMATALTFLVFLVAAFFAGRQAIRFAGGMERWSISDFEKRSDFGQVGENEVDYKLFSQWLADPDELKPYLDEKKGELEERKAKFDKRYPEPGPDASADEKAEYAGRVERAKKRWAKREDQVATLQANYDMFKSGAASIVMPLYPHHYDELRLDLDKNPPNKPSFAQGIPLGTDTSGRDVVPLLLYGFRISLVFALVVAALGYTVGIIVGGTQGYYGGWIDILSQRFVEIWSSFPFLFTIMIIASMVTPSLILLIVMLVILRSWIGITYYARGEFYREKAKDYVQAAIGAGVSDSKIILGHILPNSLVPVVTFAPFGIVAYIGSLVSLDYLGFGLPPGTPSWGGLLRQGLENVKFYPHLAIVPATALAVTLFCVVMIGEAVREAFDPKVFSRLR